MFIQRFQWGLATAFCAALCMGHSQQSLAVILAEDDFSAVDSGTGWAAGNEWENLDLANGWVTTAEGAQGFRDFATPINAHEQVTFIRFDYRQESPGDGTQWGGTAFFEGNEAATGTETFFGGGNSGAATNYAFDLKAGASLVTDIPIDDQWRTIIGEVDTTAGGGNATFKIWVDSFGQQSPNSEVTIDNAIIDEPWGVLRLASEASVTDNFDNLTIATEASDVGLISTDLELTVDRDTGAISLASPSTQDGVVGYSLTSNAGSFDQSGWTTVAGNYDAPSGGGDGSVDSDDEWMVLSDPDSTTDLSEFSFSVSPGDGGTFDSTPVDLGTPWVRSPFEDVTGTATIDVDGEEKVVGVSVDYVGTAPTPGDLNGDGNIDGADWAAFKSGQGIIDDSMTLVEAYQMGDMDGNLSHDLLDFGLFKTAYDGANGAGAFQALAGNIPEPGSALLLAAAAFLAGAAWRPRMFAAARTLAVLLAVCCLVSLSAQSAQAEIFAQDDFSAEGSGTGWAGDSDWGIVQGGVADNSIANPSFRTLETPLEPYNYPEIYVAFDFQASTGNNWGGVAFFEEVGGGAETLFIGDPSPYNAYGYDLKQGALLPENDAPDAMSPPTDGIMVDTNFHRLIAGIQYDPDGELPFEDTYSLWVDNFDHGNPDYSLTIDNSPILEAWESVRIASDVGNGATIQVDNLIITDDPDDVFVAPAVLGLVVDKATGNVQIENSAGEAISMDAYSINSPGGMLNVGGAVDGDYNEDGTVNAADYVLWRNNVGEPAGTLPNDPHGDEIGPDQYDTWVANFGETGSGEGGWESLAERDTPEAGFPQGDGSGDGWEEGDGPSPNQVAEYYLTGESSVADMASISLGEAYGGGVDGAEDLSFSYFTGGEPVTGLVSYTGGSGSGGSNAVPEPSAAALAVLATLLVTSLAPRRGSA